MANDLFRRQFASYAAVHRDPRNKTTHFIGIPAIVFSLVLLLTLWRVPGLGISWALALGVLAVAGWILLDAGIGVVLGVLMAAGWVAAEALGAQLGGTGVWIAFAILFVGGWIVQFLGHHYEGKRPALLDNIFQGFIGPIFLVGETLVAMGHRRDLAALMGDHPVTSQ